MRHGPSINSASGSTQYQSLIQHMHSLQTTANLVQSINLDTKLDAIRNSNASNTTSNHSSSTSIRTDPGFLGCLQCDLELRGKCGPTKRELALNLARLGGTLDRSCCVDISLRKVSFTPISIKFVHIFLVKLRMLRYSCVIQRVAMKHGCVSGLGVGAAIKKILFIFLIYC